eukprot:jgi/Mesen1/3589/ME000020S03119
MAKSAIFLAAAVLLLAVSSVSAVNIVGGTASLNFLMSKWVSSVNTAYKQRIAPYEVMTSSEATVAVSTNVLPIGFTDMAPFGKFPKYTFPQVVATYGLFTQTLNVQLVSASTLAFIFTGRIKRWEQVPQSIRTGPITVITQFRPSGNTFWTTKYIKSVYPAWNARLVGSGPFVFGAQAKSVLTELGTAKELKLNPLAIGFMESTTAYSNGLREICVPNGVGKPVTTLVTSVYPSIKLVPTLKPHESFLPITLINKRIAGTFPIAAFMYAVTRQNFVALGARGGIAKSFLIYTQTKSAQALAGKFKFNRLPTRFTDTNKVYINRMALAAGVKLAFKPAL